MDEEKRRECLRLARQIGVNIEDKQVKDLLTQDRLTAAEAALVLERSRYSLDKAYRHGNSSGLRTRTDKHGQYHYRDAATIDVLRWAVDRPERYRWVDKERAARYAAEDAE